MKYRFFIFGLAAILFAACAVNEEDKVNPAVNDGEEFYATIEGATTKVYVDEDLKVLWHADDRVSIFNKYTYNQQYRFTGNTGANSGSFKKVPNEDFVTGNALDYVYAVYPYQESTEISNQGLLTVELPAIQTYAEDSFGVGANTMVSCSEGNELMFKNLCGYLTLRLYGTDVSVTSISLKGNRNEPLAGKATVTAGVEAAPELQMDASATQEVTLRMDTPVTLGTTAETATTFWLVVPPTTFEGGITLLVKTADGKQFEKSTTGILAISRNTRSKMAALEVVPEAQIRYLTFTSEGTTKVSLYNRGENAPKLYYSTDLTNWIRWNYSTLTFTIDQPLYLRGNNPEGFSSSSIKFSKFVTAGDNYSVSGDIMSLIDCEHELAAIPCEFCFNSLFRGTGLISAPELPATILAEQCYSYMFSGCTSLATTPELPATSLANRCYLGMFNGCIGLTTALDLPATTLAEWCYSSMFTGCTSLIIAPELPATKLASYCYQDMFYQCQSLTTAPELPATLLAERCYSYMFSGCSSLMTAPDLLATTLENSCYQGMFYECTQLNYIKCLAEDISASGCLESWVYGVSSTGTFVKAPGVNWPTGTSGIPEGWSVINDEGGPFYPEAVDLGLPSGIKWATFNLGASKPEEYGDYYAWGETETYYSSQNPLIWKDGKELGYDWDSYKWCNGSSKTLTKYNNDASYGTVDNKTVLDFEDDAAHSALGGKWRMPTDAEFTELRENCTWEWTMLNGVVGHKVTGKKAGYTDNSIFFPAAGYRDGTSLYDAGGSDWYWSSSLFTLYTGYPYLAWRFYFYSGGGGMCDFVRSCGLSIRPVYGDLPVGSISLDKTSLTLNEGETASLTATVKPDNAYDTTVIWTSSDTSVAQVDGNGKVTAVSRGTATITVTSNDGSVKSAFCVVTVYRIETPDVVDLGLSVKWASFNLGASKPEEYGYYYAWGEIHPKSDYSWSTYEWCNGSNTSLTKYNTAASYGAVDNKPVLDPEDDAAHVALGGKWRMPTDAEFTELRENCTWTWTTVNGVKGRKVTSKKAGYTDKWIFFPAAGDWDGTSLYGARSNGSYWSSSLDTDPYYAWYVFYSDNVYRGASNRYRGQSVRPVYAE